MHCFSDARASHTAKLHLQKSAIAFCKKISVSLTDLEKLNLSSSFKTLHLF